MPTVQGAEEAERRFGPECSAPPSPDRADPSPGLLTPPSVLCPPREATANTRLTRATRRPTLSSTTTSATPPITTPGAASRRASLGPRPTATRRATRASRTTPLSPTAAAPSRAASSGPRPVGPQRPRTLRTPRASRAPSTVPPAASPPAPGPPSQGSHRSFDAVGGRGNRKHGTQLLSTLPRTAGQKTKTPRNQVNFSPPEFIFPEIPGPAKPVWRSMEKNREGTCVASRLWGLLLLQGAGRGGGRLRWTPVGLGRWRQTEGRREGRQGLEGCQVGVARARKLLEVQPAAPFRMRCSAGPSAGWCWRQDGQPGGQAPLPPPHAAWLLTPCCPPPPLSVPTKHLVYLGKRNQLQGET